MFKEIIMYSIMTLTIGFIGLLVWWMEFGSPLAHGLKEMGL